jgi:WD40-like Beta Propeller Repeat
VAANRRRGYGRWLAPAAVLAVVAVAVPANALVRRPGGGQGAGPARAAAHARPGPRTRLDAQAPAWRAGGQAARRVADPPDFALELSSTHTGAASIWMVSAATGRRRLAARVGTGNGFALSPDGSSAYVVAPAGTTIKIRRVNVAIHKTSFVADGAYPAVSPNGRYLAYATGREFRDLAVRDLRTGRTRVISLARQMGGDASFLNQGAVTWLGDGSQIVAMPEADGIATGAASSGPGAAARRSAARQVEPVCGRKAAGRQCLFVVHAGPGRLTARRIWVRGPVQLISGDMARPGTLITATGEPGPAQDLWAVRLGGRRIEATRLAAMPADSLPDAIAPVADRIVYIAGSGPPELWIATIRGGRLTGKHRLYRDTAQQGAGNAAW